ncbi:MAG: tetratricopeptide repeat protein [bacterium]
MDARSVYLKGNEFFAACNYEQALSSFLSILDTNLNDENLLLKISQCYQELSKYDEAIEFLETLLNISSQKGNYKKAIAICKRILSIDPDDTEVILKLANIFRKIKQYGEASYYYKIVAQHYEYEGFMDKAIEILQIIKELGQDGVEDLLEIIKKEYRRGAKNKVDQNIDAIISELKNGSEYALLDVALNLALTNSPENRSYIYDLAILYFKTGRLISCLHLAIWGIRLCPSESPIFIILLKSVWALGYDDTAKKLCEAVLNGEWILDDKSAKDKVKKIHSSILEFQKEKTKVEEIKNELSIKEKLDEELSYLKKQEFTKVKSVDIEHNLAMEEYEDKLQNAVEQKTTIIDTKNKTNLPSGIMEIIRESESLIDDGLYDKASQKLFGLLEEDPGNPEIRTLLAKALKLSNDMDSIQERPRPEQSDKTTDEMISALEQYLDGKSLPSEDLEIKNILGIFNSRIKDVLLPNDYNTVFDLGIAYMELDLWEEATKSFKKVMEYLSSREDDADKLTESKIYYAYSSARLGEINQLNESIALLNKLQRESSYERYKLDALYYLAICYEIKGDVTNARNSYNGIRQINPSYRDVDIRLAVIGK